MRLAFGCVALLLGGCERCANDPLNAETSPDQKHVAIAFLRDCGATSGFSTQVSILDAPGKLANQAGNVLIVEGKRPVAVRWAGDSTLVVTGSASPQTILKQKDLQGIAIQYE